MVPPAFLLRPLQHPACQRGFLGTIPHGLQGRDLRDCLSAQPVPSCSPRHCEPGSPAGDKQCVLKAVTAPQTV